MKELVEFYYSFIMHMIESAEVFEITIIHRIGLKEKLQKKFPFKKLKLFENSSIQDIWIRDFALVIIRKNIAFKALYAPACFEEKEKTYAKIDCEVGRLLAEHLDFKVQEIFIGGQRLILDGGNLIYNNTGVGITTNRIIGDNESLFTEEIKQYFYENLGIFNLIILPVEPGDDTGHIDGMVRFINDSTIAIASYPEEYEEGEIFMDKIATYLHNEFPNYEIIRVLNEIPEDLNTESQFASAFGNYINFLAVGETIFLPQYGIIEKDGAAQEIYRKYYKEIVLVNHIDIKKVARLGGVLNCITWNY